jgi:hypothetical protein
MELFLQRSQKERVSRTRFELWAKFDLSPDEKLLMKGINLSRDILLSQLLVAMA